ncbi:agenet domain-containing protein [Azospirillum sp. ST 5-10]|uniref:agenet domain-containing protein n=1 Tax=unclassified Azospirillum TaxID=2630922 RepID=UPI003F49C81F
MRVPVWLVAVAVAALAPRAVPAVVILDSTWRAEGGAPGREADGFGAHLRLAGEPQFRALMALSYDGGTVWGDGSATWIGNDGGHGYALTSAHLFDEAAAEEVLFRTDGGTVLAADRVWIHPGYDPEEDRTGMDAAVVRLVRPVTDAGPPPPLYAGTAERGRTITFVGFGMRGIGSTGEDERFHRGSAKAAAQGVVRDAAPLRRSAEDPGNHLSIVLPREGEGEAVPPLSGLLGSGDSGGSAWMPVEGRWAVVGINTSGDGNAGYGDTSWFARVSGLGPWIASVFPAARFVGETATAGTAAGTPTGAAVAPPQPPAAAAPVDGCPVRARFFVLSDGAWYPATARAPGRRPGTCSVRFDGYSAAEDEVVGPDRMRPWAAAGPGVPVAACRPGLAVVAEEDGVWYPATIVKGSARRCRVRYDDADYEDEPLPLGRLRALR